MKGQSLYRREDQIAELTTGIQLPLAPLSSFHLRFIAEVLGRAWGDLLIAQPQTLKNGNEPEVNALMETQLKKFLNEDSLWANVVRSVARGNETSSYDGTHLEGRPDLSIYLTTRDNRHPLVVECKLIDPLSKKTAGLYCKNGVTRFVIGDYAWANREAIMLAYVRDDSSVSGSLIPEFIKHQSSNPDPYRTEVLPETDEHTLLDLAQSRHGRIFKYLDGNTPGPISLWHLWVSTNL